MTNLQISKKLKIVNLKRLKTIMSDTSIMNKITIYIQTAIKILKNTNF